MYALFRSGERGKWGDCKWLVEGVMIFVGGNVKEAIGGLFGGELLPCGSWVHGIRGGDWGMGVGCGSHRWVLYGGRLPD